MLTFYSPLEPYGKTGSNIVYLVHLYGKEPISCIREKRRKGKAQKGKIQGEHKPLKPRNYEQ